MSTNFASLVTMLVGTSFNISLMEATIRRGTITFEPTGAFTGLLGLENCDLRLNTIGTEFVDDVDQLLRGVHVV